MQGKGVRAEKFVAPWARRQGQRQTLTERARHQPERAAIALYGCREDIGRTVSFCGRVIEYLRHRFMRRVNNTHIPVSGSLPGPPVGRAI